MRVLHSVSNMDRAGIETMLMNYYRFLDKNKIQFDFLCNKSKEGAYDDEILKMGGKIYVTPGLNPIKYKKYKKFVSELLLKNQYDIIHVHNGALGGYAVNVAFKNKVKNIIFHAHGASITFNYKWPLKIFCLRKLRKQINYRLACSVPAAIRYFGQKKFLNEEIIYIKNAIEISRFTFNTEIRKQIRDKSQLSNSFVIGHVGRFEKQKNHKFLFKIFDEIYKINNKAKLVLIGDGTMLKKYKQKYKNNPNILFLGNIANVNQWYQAFDCFVLPSKWEGLPVVGIEAQASDLPCFFSSNITNEVNILSKTKFISLNKSPKYWAQQILKINFCRANVDKIITDAGYNIQNEAAKLQEFYERIYNQQL